MFSLKLYGKKKENLRNHLNDNMRNNFKVFILIGIFTTHSDFRDNLSLRN